MKKLIGLLALFVFLATTTFAGAITLSHDLNGPKHRDVAHTAPTNGQILVWSAAQLKWVPSTVAGTGDFMADGSIPMTGPFTLGANYFSFTEMTPPGAGAANTARIYAENLATSGFTVLSYVDSTGMVRKLVRDSVIVVYNDTVSTMTAGKAVYHKGTATNGYPNVALAKADSILTMPAICVTAESIANASYGRCMQVGLLENIDTDSFVAGKSLYVSGTTAGALTDTAPVVPLLRQELGASIVDSATVGAMQVVARSVQQNESGTALNDWQIGAGTAGTAKRVIFHGAIDGILQWTPTSATKTITIPDASGTMMLADSDGSAITGLQFDQFINQTAWRIFYSDGSGDVQELAFGASGTHLQSGGATVAPTWVAPITVATDLIWDALGDLVVGSGSNTAARLALGTEGKVLRAGATTVDWSAYTIALPGATGAVMCSDGTNWARCTTAQFSDSAAQFYDASAPTALVKINPATVGTATISPIGAYELAYTLTGATAITFPVSGTLAILGANTFTASQTITGNILPEAANTRDIGSTSAEWAHVFLGDGGIIYGQNDQSNTITSSATGWTFAKPITVADVTNDNYIKITNNAGGRAPTASVYELYPDAGAWKANQGGTEYNVQLAGACVALTPGAAVTLTVAPTNCYTDTVTDNEDQTITFSGAGYAGQEVTIIFTTAGTADEIITFHATLVSSEGTLTLGTTAARYYTVKFISNGTHWFELSRTAVQT